MERATKLLTKKLLTFVKDLSIVSPYCGHLQLHEQLWLLKRIGSCLVKLASADHEEFYCKFSKNHGWDATKKEFKGQSPMVSVSIGWSPLNTKSMEWLTKLHTFAVKVR